MSPYLLRPVARALLLAFTLPAAVSPSRAAPAATAVTQPDDNDLVFLEVRLHNRTVTDGLNAYRHNGRVLLPLGELSRALSLAVRVQPKSGTASGFLIHEDNGFSLSVARSEVSVAGRLMQFDAAQAMNTADDIYVSADLLSKWLPATFTISLPDMMVVVDPREKLPLETRLEREQQGNALKNKEQPGSLPLFPEVPNPYGLLGMPVIDQGVSYSRSGPSSGGGATSGGNSGTLKFDTALAGDFLGMETHLYTNGSAGQGIDQKRITLSRDDPDARLLGPLHARTIALGNVSLQGLPGIVNPQGSGNGLLVSNYQATRPSRFDSQSLTGDLPAGWDVELYYNNALIGYQRARPDGKYQFDNLSLSYGKNEFKLIFHGPQGETRVEKRTFEINQSLVHKGELFYQAGISHDQNGNPLSMGQFDYGLTRNVSANVGALSATVNGVQSQYTQAGLNSFLGPLMFTTNVVKGADGGALTSFGAQTSIAGAALAGTHMILKNFQSDVFLGSGDSAVRTRDDLKATGVLPGKANPGYFLEWRRDTLVSGDHADDMVGRLSASFWGSSFSNEVHRTQNPGVPAQTLGALQLSHRVGNYGVRASADYGISPDRRLNDLTIGVDGLLKEGYQYTGSLSRQMATKDTQYTAGFTKSMGRFAAGLFVGYSHIGGLAVGMQVFISLGRDPANSKWAADARPMTTSGAVATRAFLDRNRNGVYDSGDELLKDVGFLVNGGAQASRTNSNGSAYLRYLPIRQNINMAVDPATLNDPQLTPEKPGWRFVPRPGKTLTLDFPLMLTSEIDGSIYLLRDGKKKGVGDVQVELIDDKGVVVSAARTASDGYYILQQVPPGPYQLRLAPAQFKDLGLTPPPARSVVVSADGKFLNGQDFTISPSDRKIGPQ